MNFESSVNSKSKEFKSNQEKVVTQKNFLNEIREQMLEEEMKSLEKFESKNKLLPRQRINLILDAGMPFLELCEFAGAVKFQNGKAEINSVNAGGGIIAGIGFVSGTRCMIMANNSAIKGGTISPAGLRKILRIHEICLRQNLPLLTLAESGGANLNHAHEVYVDGARAFANQSKLSAAGIPQVTIVFGNATAGGAYQPGLSDYIILIKNQSHMFLAGPPLTKAATGEETNEEELGGARLHSEISGTSEYLCENEEHAIQVAREVMAQLNTEEELEARFQNMDYLQPNYASHEFEGLIPENEKTPFDIREIFIRLCDDSYFLEFKSDYENATICAHGRIFGHKVGLIGNNGPFTAEGSGKAAQFIQLCEQAGTPLIFIHNTTGFLVGKDSERSGIIKQGSKLIQAVANSTVPKISLIASGSYGAGNYAMCGRGFDPDFLFIWPTAKTAVMGANQAAQVLRIIQTGKAKRIGKEVNEDKLQALEAQTKNLIENTSTAIFSSSQLWDDGVIDPCLTRDILGMAVETCLIGRQKQLKKNTFGIPRH